MNEVDHALIETKDSPETLKRILTFVQSANADHRNILARKLITILAREHQFSIIFAPIRSERFYDFSKNFYTVFLSNLPINMEKFIVKKKPKISIASTVIFTSPWRSENLVEALSTIGRYSDNPFKQRQNNKLIFVWPLGFAFSYNGHHSLAAGILDMDGHLIADYVLDISEFYKHFELNKTMNAFVCQEKEYPITNFTFAAILELGRYLREEELQCEDVFQK